MSLIPFLFLIGPPAAGKSTFSRKHFHPDEIVASDRCRQLVCGDRNNQAANRAAWNVVDALIRGRLEHRQRTVLDATNTIAHLRDKQMSACYGHDFHPVAVVFTTPLDECLARNARRRGARRVPEQFLIESHERAATEFPLGDRFAQLGQYAFTTILYVTPDDGSYVSGFVPRELRAETWLDDARLPHMPLDRSVFRSYPKGPTCSTTNSASNSA